MADKPQSSRDAEDFRSLRALEEIEKNPSISQRELAASMGVAVGIANSLIHALVRRGLVKIRGENNRSITYHLTKKGLTHKASLAAQWTLNTISFYREVRGIVAGGLQRIAERGATRIVVLGANEIAELAILVSRDVGLEVLGVVPQEGAYATGSLAGAPIVAPPELTGVTVDALLMCLEPHDNGQGVLLDAVRSARLDAPVYWIDGSTL